MPNRPNGPIRRGQLIAPFGPGSMVTVPGGTSLIIGGLDYWFTRGNQAEDTIDVSEFTIHEWRLERRMNVGHFRSPPDYREPRRYGQDIPNTRISIPSFRFPAWHFCPSCRLLTERPMLERGAGGRVRCPECAKLKKTSYLFQVPFVAICEKGHIQDFPWVEWVHRSLNPECTGHLHLRSTGGSSLAAQVIDCDLCDEKPRRNLAGITSFHGDSTSLTRNLSEEGEYLCSGNTPWLGPGTNSHCGFPIKGSLRNASNVYFAQIRSSIYLPRVDDPSDDELVLLLENPPISTLVSSLVSLGADFVMVLQNLRGQHGHTLRRFKDPQILNALEAVYGASQELPEQSQYPAELHLNESAETTFRRMEFELLRRPRNGDALKIREPSISAYKSTHIVGFSRILLIDKLKETRALAGFSRIYPHSVQGQDELTKTLWRNPPENRASKWLPAYEVHGEGIFFEFDEQRLSAWESQRAVIERVAPLVSRYDDQSGHSLLQRLRMNARFVMLHTFSHLLINQLTFECGYSSASLRERLYVSEDPSAPMAGVLIYTADGDSEGTMGGLVRMGQPGNLEPAIDKALAGALWCSADPVCMELGGQEGQGPDSTNLAACHNCALVPETACEAFNRYLDRGVVVGTRGDPSIGFFSL